MNCQAASIRSMTFPYVLAVACLHLVCCGNGRLVAAEPDAQQLEQQFMIEVGPILMKNCGKCHGANDPKSELTLTTFAALLRGAASGPVISPGSAEESLLVDLIQPEGEPHMPPKGQLSPTELIAISKWIDTLPKSLGKASERQVTEEDRAHWAFQPVRMPPVPETASDWSRSPIDAFIASRLSQAGLKPSPMADKLTLIRRATFDLTGLPPTRKEVEAFLADNAPDAWETLIDRLLASPRYGERWGRHWLDLARYADSNGFEFDIDRPHAFRYRDYVIRSFNDDKPYDQFVLEQLAGDEVGPQDRDSVIATGFCRNGPTVANQESEKNRLDELDDIVSTTSTVFLGLTVGCARCHDHKYDPIRQQDYYEMLAIFNSREKRDVPVPTPAESAARIRATAGLEVEIDQLRAQLAELDRQRKNSGSWHAAGGDDTVGELVQDSLASDVRLFIGKPEWTDYTLEVEAKKTAGAEGFLLIFRAADPRNFYWANFGGWGNTLHGLEVEIDGRRTLAVPRVSGKVETDQWHRLKVIVSGKRRQVFFDDKVVFDFDDERLPAGGVGLGSWITKNRWRNLIVKDAAGKVLQDGMPNLKELGIASPEEIRKQEQERQVINRKLQELEAKKPPLPIAMAIQDAGPKPRPTHLLLRGDHRIPGGLVQPAVPAVLTREPVPFPDPESGSRTTGRRATLARWIGSRENPLTARVMVNRVWQYHFGRGIVETSSNFGLNGSVPTHPELLDWLATTFMDDGWKLKSLHKRIMLSATYQQASRFREDAAAVDVRDTLLWRFPPRRLDAEEIRDSILAASGNLNLKMYGPGVKPRIDPGIIATGSTQKWPTVEKEGPEHWRRSVYIFVKRSVLMPMLEGFDAPTATQSCERRITTTVATQALQLLNNPFTNEQAKAMAEAIDAQHPDDVASQVSAAYWRGLSREPKPEELRIGMEFVEAQRAFHLDKQKDEKEAARQALADLCHVLFNLNEFVYVR